VDLTSAYNVLLNYKAPSTTQQGQCNQPRDDDDVSGLTFLQNGTTIPGTDGALHEQIKCYNCQNQGHYASVCPQENQEQGGVQLLQATHDTFDGNVDESHSEFTFLHTEGFSFQQTDARFDIIPNTWVLLDSQSTVSVFKNNNLLTNIRASPNHLRVHTNGGIQISSQKGTVKHFGDVWYNADSLANILSMAAVRKTCRITMDTSVEAAMNIHRKDGSIMKFREYKSGLYYYDVADNSTAPNPTSSKLNDYLFLLIVDGNKASFTRREVEGADKARALYRKIRPPSEKYFNEILDNQWIRNCPLTSDNAKQAVQIYGPAINVLKGKNVKKQNKGIKNYQPIQIPAPIIEKYRDLRIFMDIFFVNGTPFFHTISQWIKFRTVTAIENRSKHTLLNEAQAVINLYETRGFNVTRLEADREFTCITNNVLPINLNIADADDHVHEVERSVRTIKERVRCTAVQGLPFRRIPKMMTRGIVEGAHKSLNQFPAKNGASDILSPLTIMTGRPRPDYNDLKVE
jgi:hypothetical protein